MQDLGTCWELVDMHCFLDLCNHDVVLTVSESGVISVEMMQEMQDTTPIEMMHV